MAIPESQLETWSHQGSITQSSSTYNSVKGVLEAANAPYAQKKFNVFLQGSYGNDTNIFKESDVDVVIKLNDCFQHDLTRLPEDQQSAFKHAHNDATYTHVNFKNDVLTVLTDWYEDDVVSGEKAIAIAASGNRRKTDVIAAIQFRRYNKFVSTSDQEYEEGICFYTADGEKIANYPKQHAANLTIKHQSTGNQFKPMARILKNMRSRLISEGMLEAGTAPSYYIEGLLYNIPASEFGTTYQECFVNTINWLNNTDKSLLVCANEQYYLLREGSPVTWREEKCNGFLTAATELWNQW